MIDFMSMLYHNLVYRLSYCTARIKVELKDINNNNNYNNSSSKSKTAIILSLVSDNNGLALPTIIDGN